MFGYIKTVPSELRLREYECYRAYHGKMHGRLLAADPFL